MAAAQQAGRAAPLYAWRLARISRKLVLVGMGRRWRSAYDFSEVRSASLWGDFARMLEYSVKSILMWLSLITYRFRNQSGFWSAINMFDAGVELAFLFEFRCQWTGANSRRAFQISPFRARRSISADWEYFDRRFPRPIAPLCSILCHGLTKPLGVVFMAAENTHAIYRIWGIRESEMSSGSRRHFIFNSREWRHIPR